MLKKYLIILISTILIILPITVFSSVQNSLNLESDVVIQPGENANFNVSISLNSVLDQRVTKIEFEISKVGGSTGSIEYALVGANSLLFSSPEENKFVVIKGPKENDIITDGDMIAKITIPVNDDCPEGDIVVTIKNVKITYLPKIDSSSSSSSSEENLPVVVDGIGSTKTITVEKKNLSNVAELKSLIFSTGVPSPTFSPNVYEYEIILKDTVKSTTITAECNENCSSINGDVSPWSQKITLAEGETQNIEIKVISENLKNSEKYLLRISRGPISLDNVKLKSLSVTNASLDTDFSSDKYNYYVNLPYEMENIDIIYELNDITSSAIITGNDTIIAGEENEIKITVKSDDEKNELTYTLYVTREDAPSSSSSSSIINSSSSDEKNGNNKYTIVGIIIFGSLLIIGVSFYLLFKLKNKKKNVKQLSIEKINDQPVVSISHNQDLELLELTKEYVGLNEEIKNINNINKNNK